MTDVIKMQCGGTIRFRVPASVSALDKLIKQDRVQLVGIPERIPRAALIKLTKPRARTKSRHGVAYISKLVFCRRSNRIILELDLNVDRHLELEEKIETALVAIQACVDFYSVSKRPRSIDRAKQRQRHYRNRRLARLRDRQTAATSTGALQIS